MLVSNNNCYYIIYDDTMDGDAEHVYNWGGYYYVVNRLSELLQKGMIKRYAEIREKGTTIKRYAEIRETDFHETNSYETVLRVEIKKEVKA